MDSSQQPGVSTVEDDETSQESQHLVLDGTASGTNVTESNSSADHMNWTATDNTSSNAASSSDRLTIKETEVKKN